MNALVDTIRATLDEHFSSTKVPSVGQMLKSIDKHVNFDIYGGLLIKAITHECLRI